MKKLNAIQALRALAAFGVVVFHLISVENKYAGGDVILSDKLNFLMLGVDLFFVISGFIMMTLWLRGNRSAKDSFTFLVHRAARIYPTYWFYFCITLMVYLLMPGTVNTTHGNVGILNSFFLLPSHKTPLVLVAWSLVYELFFYLVFAVLLNFNKKVMVAGLICWASLLIGSNLLLNLGSDINPYLELVTNPYSLEFILGAFSAVAVHKLNTRLVHRWVLWLMLAGLLLIPGAYGAFNDGNTVLRAFVFGGLFSVALTGLYLLEENYNLKISGKVVFLGDISYSVYLSHLLVLGAIGRIWSHFSLVSNFWDHIIAITLMVVSVILFSSLAYKFFERPSYQYLIRKFGSAKNNVV